MISITIIYHQITIQHKSSQQFLKCSRSFFIIIIFIWIAIWFAHGISPCNELFCFCKKYFFSPPVDHFSYQRLSIFFLKRFTSWFFKHARIRLKRTYTKHRDRSMKLSQKLTKQKLKSSILHVIFLNVFLRVPYKLYLIVYYLV